VLRQQAASILECDFLTIDTPLPEADCVLFVVGLASRRAHRAGAPG
jgi:hypothetical protein